MGQLENLRSTNRARVVDALRTGTLSRSELVRRTGLSRATVGAVVNELDARGLVVEGEGDLDRLRPGRGRPPMLLSLHPSAGAALGVAFGHERLQVAVADLSSNVLAEREADLDVDHKPSAAIGLAVSMARTLLKEAGVSRDQVIGATVGMPAPVDVRTQMISPTPILSRWVGIDTQAEFSRVLGLPVLVENDANLDALGEFVSGAGRGFTDVVYVTLSAGVGAGLVLNGQLYRGWKGSAGELGHVQVSQDGEPCRCGRTGCLETVASSGAVLRVLRPAHGDELTLERALALATDGDVGVRRVLGDVGHALGGVLADVCNCLDPGAIIVGGELSAGGAYILEGVRSAVDRYALPAAAASVEVLAGSLGERAALLGAISLVAGDVERFRSDQLPALDWAR